MAAGCRFAELAARIRLVNPTATPASPPPQPSAGDRGAGAARRSRGSSQHGLQRSDMLARFLAEIVCQAAVRIEPQNAVGLGHEIRERVNVVEEQLAVPIVQDVLDPADLDS